MATEKMIRTLAKDLATLIAAIDRAEDGPYSNDGDQLNVSDFKERQAKNTLPKKTNKKD